MLGHNALGYPRSLKRSVAGIRIMPIAFSLEAVLSVVLEFIPTCRI